jgi:outer membrane protein insertion porin family
MMRNVARLFLAFLFTCTSLAQTQPQRKGASVSAYKITRIGITGNSRYPTEQILPLLGLRVGEPAADGDFQIAVQKLGETGLFTDVSFTYSYSPAGTEVDFQVKENDKLLPVRFENLVWFSDQEWIDKLRSVVPLFQGELPDQGTLTDIVADALQTMVAERGNTVARVEVRRPGDEESNISDIVFSVTGLPIRIQSFDFPGAADAERAQLAAAAKRLVGEEYGRSVLDVLARLDLTPVYQREGKLRAHFAEAQAKLLSDAPQAVEVQAVLSVEEGATYKLGKFAWSGNKLFAAAKLDPALHVKAGAAVNAVELTNDLTKVVGMYRMAGYMRAEVVPQATLNDADATVDYQIEIKEGAQYKMGELDISGLNDKGKGRVLQAWNLREGDPYNPAYTHNFVKQPEAAPLEGNWKIDIAEAVNDSDKTVDVTLTYANLAAK